MVRQYSRCDRRYVECVVWWAKDSIKLLHVRMKYLLRCELWNKWAEWYDNSVMGSFARQTVWSMYHCRALCYSYSIVSPCYICMLEGCASMVINKPAVLIISSLIIITGVPGQPYNSQLSWPFWNWECQPKHINFFIQAMLYTFFISRYDSNGFLYNLTKNFGVYHYRHIQHVDF